MGVEEGEDEEVVVGETVVAEVDVLVNEEEKEKAKEKVRT